MSSYTFVRTPGQPTWLTIFDEGTLRHIKIDVQDYSTVHQTISQRDATELLQFLKDTLPKNAQTTLRTK